MIYGPFSSVEGITECAIALRVAINFEREYYEYSSKEYEALGGKHATGEDFFLAQAYKNNADCHKYALRILESLAQNFAKTLTPDALNDILDMFKYLDDCKAKSKEKHELPQ